MLPPYTERQAKQLAEEVGHENQQYWLWNRDDAAALYAAGGGDKARFDEVYQSFLEKSSLFGGQVEAGTYFRTGGGHHYLITAITPTSSFS